MAQNYAPINSTESFDQKINTTMNIKNITIIIPIHTHICELMSFALYFKKYRIRYK